MTSNSKLINLSEIKYDNNDGKLFSEETSYGWIEKMVMSLKQFGENKMNVDAAYAVANEVSVLVCGPSRVGKSSLTKALTGCDVPTSSGLDPHTKHAKGYKYEKEKVVIWDTKGFENWDKKVLDNFWKQHVIDKKVLPSFCFFCVGNGAYANTNLIKYMFDEFLFPNKIPVCWVITKGGHTDKTELLTLIQEGEKLLGEITDVINDTLAWKAQKGFIIRVNSVDAELCIANTKIPVPVFGINTLGKILAQNVSLETQQHLIKLFKKNQSYLSHVYAALFELSYKIGFPVTRFLEKEKKELFEKASNESFNNLY